MKSVTKLLGLTGLALALTYGGQQTFVEASDSMNDSIGAIQPRWSDDSSLSVPGGTLTSNVWRQSVGTNSGNTIKWDFQVSAVYSGTGTVERIRTTWKGSASLRSSAEISLGVDLSTGGVSAGSGSSWQTVTTPTKFWENSNGAKTSDYRSNLIVGPSKDYRTNTAYIQNTALVKIKGYAKTYEINAGA